MAAGTLTVGLGERSYPIEIGRGSMRVAGRHLAALGVHRAVIVTNPTVASLHLSTLRTAVQSSGIACEAILVPDGEVHKNWSTLNDVLTRLLEIKAERSTCLVALGGGVVGDLTGFAAAIFQRGMPYVQIPTTLLAQVDSSVGGKTAVNHPLGKNMIGAFYQPRAVLIDVDCLATLPDRELSAGVAEVIKYGAIREAPFFDWLEDNIEALLARDGDALEHAIGESCRCKAEIVGADERETGERALLNFGHTFGHAIETASGYGSWLHGEAVAAGMVCAAKLSVEVRGLAPSDATRVADLIARARLPVRPPKIAIDRWLELMSRDKKVAAGAIRFVLLDAIGDARLVDNVASKSVADVLA